MIAYDDSLLDDHQEPAPSWIQFVKNKIVDLQMYNLWHEDRVAAAMSVEHRVPFLNNRVAEAALSVPKHMWESMFF